jgi:hypothetical protein
MSRTTITLPHTCCVYENVEEEEEEEEECRLEV